MVRNYINGRSWLKDFLGSKLGIMLPHATLHLTLVRSLFKGSISEIDTKAAENTAGVYKIITCHDVKGTNRLKSPGAGSDDNGIPVICSEDDVDVGSIVAVICAVNQTSAVAAAKRVKVAYRDDILNQKSLKAFYARNVYSRQQKSCEGFACLNDKGAMLIYSRLADHPVNRIIISSAIGIRSPDMILLGGSEEKRPVCKYNFFLSALLGISLLATGRPVFLDYPCSMQLENGRRQIAGVKYKKQ